MAAVHFPPPKSPPKPVFFGVPRDSTLFRIYNPEPFKTTATTFRTYGPRLRFDHQPGLPHKAKDFPARGILYAALQLAPAICEVYGDERQILFGPRKCAVLRVLRDLRLVDLDAGAMSNGTLSAIGSVTSRRLSQAWARYYYEESLFMHADGLYYRSAHNAGLCVALFERARDALFVSDDRLFSDPIYEGDILKTATSHGMVIFR